MREVTAHVNLSEKTLTYWATHLVLIIPIPTIPTKIGFTMIFVKILSIGETIVIIIPTRSMARETIILVGIEPIVRVVVCTVLCTCISPTSLIRNRFLNLSSRYITITLLIKYFSCLGTLG
uniref:Uncharacterized protein n=1 Tax=Cacopsylla melanoneura TaxID=428564 RepID=A0A8D9DRT6_9HEMI